MIIKRLIYIAITIILGLTIWGTGLLARREWLEGDICPTVLGTPACYIVLVCFASALVLHISLFKPSKYFLLFIGAAGLMPTYGSHGEIFGFAECPRTSSGIPMCFISFSICVTLLILKIIEIKRTKDISL